MPQMAPLSWLSLMIMFILMMIMINSLTYFNKNYNIQKKTKEMKIKKINWKW
uniref:ATP synthase F0 subunit 8 n=1 Tax=Halobates peronis TaxID=1868693 RepID=UPI001EDECBF0|nr:ATP synthase F0 subunit 8 [Halobates peronis]UIG88244.1 ATP synthase F0 subunit 8 [Halobates peronis]